MVVAVVVMAVVVVVVVGGWVGWGNRAAAAEVAGMGDGGGTSRSGTGRRGDWWRSRGDPAARPNQGA